MENNKYIYLILILFTFCFSSFVHASWQIQTVDNNTDDVWSLSFDLDSKDNPHIAYIKHERLNGGGQRNDYYYSFYEDKWNTELMFSGADGLSYINLAIDHTDTPVIVYTNAFDFTEELVYLHKNNNTWQTDTIDEGVWQPSISIDQNNNPGIMYSVLLSEGGATWNGKYDIRYAYKDNDWLIENAYETTGYADFGSLTFAFDSNNNRHAFFTATCLGDTRDPRDIGLNYLYINNDIAWYHELLEFTKECSILDISKIALDSNDQPWVAYYHHSTESINLIKKSESGWETMFEDENAYSGTPVSLVLDSLDRPHLVYNVLSYAKERELTYVHYEDDWMYDVIDHQPFTYFFIELELDSNDNPHIVYKNSEQISYARWVEGIPVPKVKKVFPSSLSDKENSQLIIHGSNFIDGVSVKLTRKDQDDILAKIRRRNNNNIICSFDLNEVVHGSWNVEVYNSIDRFFVLENGITIEPQQCLFEQFIQNDTTLKILRTLRDEVLNNTSDGAEYIRAYYHHTGELANIIISDSQLKKQFLEIVENFSPIAKSILNKNYFTLTETQVKEIISFLDKVYRKSPNLKAIIEKATTDIRNGKFR